MVHSLVPVILIPVVLLLVVLVPIVLVPVVQVPVVPIPVSSGKQVDQPESDMIFFTQSDQL